MDNRTHNACVSRNSTCIDDLFIPAVGYICSCDGGYQGNPYILDGCLRDTGNLIYCRNYRTILDPIFLEVHTEGIVCIWWHSRKPIRPQSGNTRIWICDLTFASAHNLPVILYSESSSRIKIQKKEGEKTLLSSEFRDAFVITRQRPKVVTSQ